MFRVFSIARVPLRVARGSQAAPLARSLFLIPRRALEARQSLACTGGVLNRLLPRGGLFSLRTFAEMAEEEAPKTSALSTRVIAAKAIRKAPKYTLFVFLFGAACIGTFYIGRELMPTTFGPTGMYDDAYEYLKNDQRILNYFGSPLKAYGTEYNGHREGRRNTVQSFTFIDENGLKHMRVLFHVKGPRAKGNVYVEKTKGMGKHDFHYLIIQVPSSGDVISVLDHREPITREVMQQQVAQKLSQIGAIVFGRDSCPFTQKQKDELGASQYMVKYINCDQEREMCERFQIAQYPTWIIQSQSFTGMRTIEELSQMFQRY